MSPPKVTALGGGHGLSASLQALRQITDELVAVVTVADNGGSSGRLRRSVVHWGAPPPRCLTSCARLGAGSGAYLPTTMSMSASMRALAVSAGQGEYPFDPCRPARCTARTQKAPSRGKGKALLGVHLEYAQQAGCIFCAIDITLAYLFGQRYNIPCKLG